VANSPDTHFAMASNEFPAQFHAFLSQSSMIHALERMHSSSDLILSMIARVDVLRVVGSSSGTDTVAVTPRLGPSVTL